MIHLIHHAVDMHARQAPEREAFSVPGSSLSYADIAAASNRLAHYLVANGVQRGDRVGVFMPRGLQTAVAVYGVLKAGAAFVPIDPHLPASALARLVDDCGIRVLLSEPAQRRVLADYAGTAAKLDLVVGVEQFESTALRGVPWSVIDDFPDGQGPDVPIIEDDLAYIMYSSGSTGRPKGIMHTHRSGLAYARLSAACYDIGVDDRIGNHSPLHFDMSTLGYLTAPLAGATTVIIPEAYVKMAASLAKLIEAQRITIWYSVPLALTQLLLRGAIETCDLGSIRWVLYGGEPFPIGHLRELMQRLPQARFSNVYGPAEVNQCTYYHIPRDAAGLPRLDQDATVPLGSIWDNTEGRILDDGDRPVADGEPGELVIRSPTMMRGYWARPDLNLRAFYREPVYEGFERVFYRTGDLVRRGSDDELLFLGRKDRQVKVRGYRIELDDVEHMLGLHPQVEEAAVFPVRIDGIVDHTEAAVIVRGGAAIGADQLKAHLAQRLSNYAVPHRIGVHETFPRTTSGKIDRRALQSAAEQAMAGGT